MKGKLIAFAGRMGVGKDTAAEFLQESGYIRIALADELKRFACHLFEIPPRYAFGPSALRNQVLVDTSERFWDRVHARVEKSLNWIHMLFESAVVNRDPVMALHEVIEKIRQFREITVRLVLQLLGTEWGRSVDDLVWIRALMRTSRVVIDTNVPYTPEKGLDYQADPTIGPPKPLGVVVTDARFPNEVEAVQTAGGRVFWIEPGARVPAPPRTHASEPDYSDLAAWVTGVIPNMSDVGAFRVNVLLAVSPGA